MAHIKENIISKLIKYCIQTQNDIEFMYTFTFTQTKDTKTNRGIFVTKSEIKRKMKKSDFQNPKRLEFRENMISKMLYEEKLNVHFDPLMAKNTQEIFQLFGKYWLRYICLLLPTLDKFALPAVCKTFHMFVTLQIGQEDTPDPPPFDQKVYKELLMY